jgi:hypothetical protein
MKASGQVVTYSGVAIAPHGGIPLIFEVFERVMVAM